MTEQLLDKQLVRQSFAAAAASYDAVAGLQRQVGLELLRRNPVMSNATTVMDLGCGTGFMAGEIIDSGFAGLLLAADLALPMLQVSRQKRPNAPIQYLCADAARLPVKRGTVDSLYSNLAFQWLEDLPVLFSELRRVLRPGGQVAFSSFGPRTLHELKAAWAQVDDAVHVNEFVVAGMLEACLAKAGFVEVNIEPVLYRSEYPSVIALMQELKGLGAHNVNRGRKLQPTTKFELRRMMEAYQQSMPEATIVASYEVLFVRAKVC